ncbi:MAG TPA: sigma-54-dependent Fis family transcriptional regulator [Acidiferrobacteraceae bacterium]|nr:sigma-54-dependent Fis family transcriptional regulator [Acidiferrobacteraceae bacterium]
MILVVDDEPDIRRTVKDILEDENYKVETAENATMANRVRSQQRPDLVLLDIWMPDTDGISLLKEWSGPEGQDVPVVMMSGHGSVETAVEAIRHGAYDFIEKPLSMAKLLVTVERAIQTDKLRKENLRLRQRLEPVATLIGKSAPMERLREQTERTANTDSWVLITGEPGSGKGVVARCLHNESPRKHAQFVDISLAAIPPSNIATQLFGSEEGGKVRPGRFEQAAGGTLFLDEIGDMDLDIQAKLLSALEENRFLRVGGTQTVDVDVRIIAATNQDLEAAVAVSRFREDLYYRLNVVPLHVPPLRDHREDIPDIVNFYLNWMVEKEHLPYRKFSVAALNMLRNHIWPGNVRELKNLVQRLLILNRGEEVARSEVELALGNRKQASTESFADDAFGLPLRDARDQFEKAYLEYHLLRSGGNVSELAQASGMERTHLYRKIKSLGINPKLGKVE